MSGSVAAVTARVSVTRCRGCVFVNERSNEFSFPGLPEKAVSDFEWFKAKNWRRLGSETATDLATVAVWKKYAGTTYDDAIENMLRSAEGVFEECV